MDEIKFKLVDGEPVCDSGCKHYASKRIDNLSGYRERRNYCTAEKEHLEVFDDSPCIPGLRQQRDEARAALADREAVIGRVREWSELGDGSPGYIQARIDVEKILNARALLTPAPATGDAMGVLLNTSCQFGLEAQGHIPTIKKMLFDGVGWDEIAKKINWEKGPLEEFGEDAVLAIVETNGGPEYYLCRVDHGGMLLDLQHGDDYGWSAIDVSWWIPLEKILTEMGGEE